MGCVSSKDLVVSFDQSDYLTSFGWDSDLKKDGFRIRFTDDDSFFIVDNDLLQLELQRIGVSNPKYLEIEVQYNSKKEQCFGNFKIPLFHKDGFIRGIEILDCNNIPGNREPLKKFLDPIFNPLIQINYEKVIGQFRVFMVTSTSENINGLKTHTVYIPPKTDFTSLIKKIN